MRAITCCEKVVIFLVVPYSRGAMGKVSEDSPKSCNLKQASYSYVSYPRDMQIKCLVDRNGHIPLIMNNDYWTLPTNVSHNAAQGTSMTNRGTPDAFFDLSFEVFGRFSVEGDENAAPFGHRRTLM